MKGVLLHKPSSVYDDDPATRYHFPAQYKSVADRVAGDWVLYYEPGAGARHYKAVARIADIIRDPVPRDRAHYYARVEPGTYLDFVGTVPLRRADGSYQNSEIENADAGRRSFLTRRSVRIIPDADFVRIVAEGLAEGVELPETMPREDVLEGNVMTEDAALFDTPFSRPTVDTLLSRKVRDRAFRASVLKAYGSRCAFTRLRFINGGGRAEVQAAHIRPVSEGGPDSVRNGLALSGTVHWMFDRGLLSLGDDHEILVSRHINNTDEVARLIPERKASVPDAAHLCPHPAALAWHREHVFKT